jgi:hypothetical protein
MAQRLFVTAIARDGACRGGAMIEETLFRGAPATWREDVAPPAAMSDMIRTRIKAARSSRVNFHARAALGTLGVLVLTALIVAVASELTFARQAAGLAALVRSTSWLAFVSVGLVALTLASTTIVMWRGRSGLGPDVVLAALTAMLAAPLYTLLVIWRPVHMGGDAALGVEVSQWGARCLLIAAVVGLAALACLTAALRRSVAVSATIRGAALGAAAGFWAGVAVFIFCPSGETLHLLVGHALPIAAFTALGAAIAPRILRA